jgi:hypothetical protein
MSSCDVELRGCEGGISGMEELVFVISVTCVLLLLLLLLLLYV